MLFDDSAPALAASDSTYYPHGVIEIVGLTSTGEVALGEVHMPRSLDVAAPRLTRLFVLRGGRLVLIAQRAAAPEDAYGARAWVGRLPEGFRFSVTTER
jgi:hypothetical protein